MPRYQWSENIDIQPMDNSWIVLDLEGNVYYSLNETAHWYIHHFLNGTEIPKLAEMAVDRYEGVTKEQAQTDIETLISNLCRLNLLIDTDISHLS